MLLGIFLTIVNMSIIGGLAILLVLLVRLPLSKAPKVFSYCLWAVVLFRLLVPFSFESVVSLIPVHRQPIPLNLASMQTPAIDTGIQVVDKTVSAALPTAAVAGDASALPMMLTVMETIWLAVMLAMLGFGLYSLLKLKYKLRTATLLEGNIYQCGCVDTPFVLGILKPRIYLPTGLNEIECEYILLHEQNHIRRGDHIIRILGYLALCIHWFNPLVWIAFRASGKDMEMANDESVIRRKGESIKNEYSSSLLALSTGRRRVSPVPLAFGEEDPKSRIHNIINYKKPVMGVMLAAIVVVATVSVGLLLNTNNDKDNGNQINLETMKASEIVNVLSNLGYPVGGGKNYDETGDTSQYPWNIPGCTSAAEFWIPNGSTDGESMGLIEVYNSVNACTARRESFPLYTSAYDPYDYLLQAGKVFVQVPLILSKTAVTQYKSALQAMAQGKRPEPYLGVVSSDDKPSSQEVAAAQSVVEEYFRACKDKDSQAILKTLTPEYNRPNTFLFGEETKTLLKIDYNPEDPMRQTYITSGRGSVNDAIVENVIVFRVSFNIEYPEGVIGAWNEGKYEDWNIILIREDKDSPWLIDDQGW